MCTDATKIKKTNVSFHFNSLSLFLSLPFSFSLFQKFTMKVCSLFQVSFSTQKICFFSQVFFLYFCSPFFVSKLMTRAVQSLSHFIIPTFSHRDSIFFFAHFSNQEKTQQKGRKEKQWPEKREREKARPNENCLKSEITFDGKSANLQFKLLTAKFLSIQRVYSFSPFFLSFSYL